MIIRSGAWVLAALLVTACSRAPEEPANVADLVILDGAIETMDPAQPQVRALAVRDGKVAYLGDDETARKWVGKDTRVVEAKGMSVWPGLIDSHIHLMEGALTLDDCTFNDAPLTVAQIGPIIKECVARTPGDGWVTVQNLNAAGFKATRKDLDAIVAQLTA